jgi:hypothetical protein
MFIIQKHLKSNLAAKRFDLLKKEVSLLNKQQSVHQAQTQFDASRLATLEKVLSAIIAQNTGYSSDDDGGGMMH